MRVYYRVKGKMCTWSNGQRLKYSTVKHSFCNAVKWLSTKNDGQDLLTLVTTCSVCVTPLCVYVLGGGGGGGGGGGFA